MSTNFLQWNPAANNQEPDSTYVSDSQRVNGAINGQILNDQLANKLFYQLSTWVTAQANALVAKGYSPNDSSLSALESVVANFVTFADLKSNLTSVSFSPTPAFNATNSNGFDIVLAGNVTSSTLTGTQVGQTIVFVVVQGATPFSFSPPPNINDWIPIDMTPNSVTVQAFFVRQDGTIWSLFTEITLILAELASLQSQITGLSLSITRSVNLAGSRSLDSVYRNTTAGFMTVSGYVTTSGSSVGNIAVRVSSTNPPTDIVFSDESTASVTGGALGFMSPPIGPGEYYSVSGLGDVVAIGTWYETVTTI